MRPITTRAGRSPLLMLTVAVVLCALCAGATACESSATAATQGTTASAGGRTDSTAPAGEAPETTVTATGTGLFDSSVVHEISVSFAQEDYEAMIQAYQETGDKEWIEATVTIDGKTFQNVGLRLKGNSSIMGLRTGGAAGAPAAGGRPRPEDAGESDSGDTTDAQAASGAQAAPGAPAGGGQTGRDQTGGGQGFTGAMSGDASTDAPETLPWLVDLDRNVENQNYEGLMEFAVRSNTSETALNEAVALDLLREAGLASQEAAYVSFSINGSEARLRLVVENPDDLWMAANFAITGALYKAESTGDYSYRGDEADSYDEVFDQEAGKTNADLTPLIEFLAFINNADDATFNAELPDRLDIDAFATYLAMEELLDNFDDIDGPGNNSYLYYDTKTKKFTIVPWDHNLAFGAMNGAGGGFGGGLDGGFDGGFDGSAPAGLPGAGGQTSEGTLPEGTQPTGRMVRPGGGQGQAGMAGGLGGKANILVDRFKADPEWQQLYEERLAALKVALYDSGVAADILAGWVDLLKTQASELVEASTVDQEAASISTHFTAE